MSIEDRQGDCPAHTDDNMKTRKLTLGALILAGLVIAGLSVAGCDDFLASEPLGELTSESFFETQDHALWATNATYAKLRDWNVHVFAWIGMTDIAGDDAHKGSTPTDADFLGDLDDMTHDAGNIAFNDTWQGYFQGVHRANTAIRGIPNVEMDEQLKARLIAENKFLRAYFYFFLVRAFGGVPLITEPLDDGPYQLPRASEEEIYDLIEQDLKEAIEVLPEKSAYSASDVGRATKGAARGLLAKVNLFRGDYAEAELYARQVIDSGEYSLVDDYWGIFRQSGEHGPESVFEASTVALEEGGAGSQYAQVQGVRGEPNLGWGFNVPTTDLEAAFEPGDPRQQATILYEWEMIPDGSGAFVRINQQVPVNRYNEKAQPPLDSPGGSGNSGVNIRRLRYSDVILIAAEAAFRNGNEGEARRLLNMVRQARREGRQATLGIQPEQMADEIATDRLGLTAGNRVFARYVHPDSPAADAGLQSTVISFFTTPAVVEYAENMDVITSVGGTPINNLNDYNSATAGLAPGEQVPVTILRVRQTREGDGVATTTETIQATITAAPLLPDVTASGQDLLEAIWHERRVELALEQHRFFDIVRQGRAAQLLNALGIPFVEGKHNRYPIPTSEIDLSGGLITQNPGY